MQKRCIDCIHESACREIYDTAGLTFDCECPNMDQLCNNFSHKELNIQIPCVPGTKVYSVVGFNGRPENADEYVVSEININEEGLVYMVIHDRVGFERRMLPQHIGSVIFFNKEDAEKEYQSIIAKTASRKAAIGDTLYVLTCDSPTGVEETRCRSIKTKHLDDVGETPVYIAPCVYDDWGGARWEFYDWDFGVKVFTDRTAAYSAAEKERH